ncbi:MAG: helix-turn-helix domain-containing protein [Clostridiales bacterium]|nr:helix-turn-helix domain-containing protein [Clostridiales bacterium]
MEIQDILKQLRIKHGLTQEEMAERAMVTRQAVSRWENGETQPNTDTLMILSRAFDVSINTLLGAPRTLFCQCCGMPLTDDGLISREPDGRFNEDYCKWCYVDGAFAYATREELLEFLLAHMPNADGASEEARRSAFDAQLAQLKHWKQA